MWCGQSLYAHNVIGITIIFRPSLINPINESPFIAACTLQDKLDILLKSGQARGKEHCGEIYLVS
jgi:hypothetical protein